MSLEAYLEQIAPFPISIEWHQNRTLYVSFTKRKRSTLRLHRLFETASLTTWEALGRFIFERDQSAKKEIRRAIQAYFTFAQAPPERLPSQGAIYDLSAIYTQIKEQYFADLEEDLSIGWVKSRSGHNGRCMTLGCYDVSARQIRIHADLDHEAVPIYFLEFVVYHEILHAVCPPIETKQGRMSIHTAAFRRREKLFLLYKQAKRFEKDFQRKRYGRS